MAIADMLMPDEPNLRRIILYRCAAEALTLAQHRQPRHCIEITPRNRTIENARAQQWDREQTLGERMRRA